MRSASDGPTGVENIPINTLDVKIEGIPFIPAPDPAVLDRLISSYFSATVSFVNSDAPGNIERLDATKKALFDYAMGAR